MSPFPSNPQQGPVSDIDKGSGSIPGRMPTALVSRLIALFEAGDYQNVFTALPKAPKDRELEQVRAAARIIAKRADRLVDGPDPVDGAVADVLLRLALLSTRNLDPFFLASVEAELYYDQHEKLMSTAMRVADEDSSDRALDRQFAAREALLRLYFESEKYDDAQMIVDDSLELLKEIPDFGEKNRRGLLPMWYQLQVAVQTAQPELLVMEATDLARTVLFAKDENLTRAQRDHLRSAMAALDDISDKLYRKAPRRPPRQCQDPKEYKLHICLGEIYCVLGRFDEAREQLDYGLALVAVSSNSTGRTDHQLSATAALLAVRAENGEHSNRLLGLGFDVRDLYFASNDREVKRYSMEILNKFLPAVATGIRKDLSGD